MNPIALVGIDLGKNTFHVHAQDRHGKMVHRKKHGRAQLLQWLVSLPPCTVAMEACGGAHYLAFGEAKEVTRSPRRNPGLVVR